MINTPYAERRERFYKRLPAQAAAILIGAAEVKRNGSNTHRFRQASDLLYLTGFEEPDAVAVFTPGKPKRFTLFLRARDTVREQWTGRRLGLDEAVEHLGADQAFDRSELETRLYELLDGCSEVHSHISDDESSDALLLRVLRRLRQNERNGARAPQHIVDLASTLHEERLIKDAAALTCMKKAAAATTEAHFAAMRAARPGRREFELEALIDYIFRRHDGFPGYDTIVAGGNNATTLHYTGGRDALRPGEMLIVDAGCELGGFTADVTRSYPIPTADGRPAEFTDAQLRLYEVVLAAQRAGIECARPGATIEDIHHACVAVATAGLRDLGLLRGDLSQLLAEHQYRRFYIHRTSHFLGMDVHDVGHYFPGGPPRRLLPGMILTIEPGIYIRADANLLPGLDAYRGIGIRIEDDVLITEPDGPLGTGHEVLTRDVPKDPKELLPLIGSGLRLDL